MKLGADHVVKQMPLITDQVAEKIRETSLELADEISDKCSEKAAKGSEKLELSIAQGITRGIQSGCISLEKAAQDTMNETRKTVLESHTTALRKSVCVAIMGALSISGIYVGGAGALRYNHTHDI